MTGKERHMKMTAWEKKLFREKRKSPITPTNEQPSRIGSGRRNERFECAATRRATDIYVQNF